MIVSPGALFHRLLDRRADHLAGRLVPHLRAGASLLDVGSGTGHNARALQLRSGGPCLETDVVDFHVVGPGPILFDGSRLAFPDDVVDVCMLAFVLSYTADPAGLLRDAGRVASRRVLLLQSTCRGPWSRTALHCRSWLQGALAFRLCRALGLIPPAKSWLRPRRLFAREEVEAIIAEAGLTLVGVEAEPGFAAAISRDLFILDRRPATGDHPRDSWDFQSL